jgi:hypothetical protein
LRFSPFSVAAYFYFLEVAARLPADLSAQLVQTGMLARAGNPLSAKERLHRGPGRELRGELTPALDLRDTQPSFPETYVETCRFAGYCGDAEQS